MASIKRHGSSRQPRVRKRGVSMAKTFDRKMDARRWATRIEAELDEAAASGKAVVLDYTIRDGITTYKDTAG
jgi:hypothetical protein